MPKKKNLIEKLYRKPYPKNFTTRVQAGNIVLTDSVIELDVSITGQMVCSSDSNALGLKRSLVKGTLSFSAGDNGRMFHGVEDSIIDVYVPSSTNLGRPQGTLLRSVFNKQKITSWSGVTGLAEVTSADLLSPTALQAAGLSIGVDT